MNLINLFFSFSSVVSRAVNRKLPKGKTRRPENRAETGEKYRITIKKGKKETQEDRRLSKTEMERERKRQETPLHWINAVLKWVMVSLSTYQSDVTE